MNVSGTVDDGNGRSVRRKLYDQFADCLQQIEPRAAVLYRARSDLLANHVNETLRARPDLTDLIGANPITVMYTNHRYHATFMRSAFTVPSAMSLVEVCVWSYRTHLSRGFSPAYFPAEIEAWKQAVEILIASETPARHMMAVYDAMLASHEAFLRLASQPESAIVTQPEYEHHARQFLEALLRPSESEAESLLLERIRGVGEIPKWWEHVVTPAMRNLGRMWSTGEISVAQEHIASAIARRVVARCFPRLPRSQKRSGRIAVAAAPNEFHDLGAAMVRDCLELADYDVLFTGANTPIETIAPMVSDGDLQAMLVSTTMPFNLADVKELIDTTRAARPDLHIIVGGQAYEADPDLYRRIGADAHIPTLGRIVGYLQQRGLA